MEVIIFKDLTTDEYLTELEKKATEYEGLYVDMDNAKERKFVKDKAYDIQQLIKKVDRKRIDESKDYKAKVEAEAALITSRLQEANAPFQFLIDQHKAERAKILAEEKAKREAEELAIQIQVDHEDAINLNKLFDLEKMEAERVAQENHAKMVAQIAEQEKAKLAEQAKQQQAELEQAKVAAEQAEKQRVIDAEKAEQEAARRAEQARLDEIARQKAEQEDAAKLEADRLANIEHVTSICTQVKLSLMDKAGLTEEQAIATVKAIRSESIFNTSIKF